MRVVAAHVSHDVVQLASVHELCSRTENSKRKHCAQLEKTATACRHLFGFNIPIIFVLVRLGAPVDHCGSAVIQPWKVDTFERSARGVGSKCWQSLHPPHRSYLIRPPCYNRRLKSHKIITTGSAQQCHEEASQEEEDEEDEVRRREAREVAMHLGP